MNKLGDGGQRIITHGAYALTAVGTLEAQVALATLDLLPVPKRLVVHKASNTVNTSVLAVVGEFINELASAMTRTVVRASTALTALPFVTIEALAFTSFAVT
jgi:hypothetical protein